MAFSENMSETEHFRGRSTLGLLKDPAYFFWATGIEDTFITEPWPATGRTLDEYELTQHYDQWREDLGLIQELGVSHARYGIPWHRINPERGVWDWDFADQTIDRLLDLGIEPILDLVHYGVPRWIEGAYLHPEFPSFMSEYARRAAERFKGRVRLWTPLNEPRVTAWYCGKLGWWPPFERGWTGFVKLTLSVARAIVQTSRALERVDEENVSVHVDATDLYESEDFRLSEEVHRRQEIVFLALDLISGRVQPGHSLYAWLIKHGVTERELEWFQEQRLALDVIGINLYPLFSRKVLSRAPHLRMAMPYASADIVERLARMYFERYQTPVFISETASLGSIKRRDKWLQESVEAAMRARERGVPLAGYTWWPLFALVTWAYRQGKHPPAYYLKQMGLWDIKTDHAGKMNRVRTRLVDSFQEMMMKVGTRPEPELASRGER